MEDVESNLPQSGVGNKVQDLLLFFGERLAFILFFLFICALLVSGQIVPQAFSKQEDPQIIQQETNWYGKSVSFTSPPQKEAGETYEVKMAVATPSPTPTPLPVMSDDVWEKLAQCETHANWSANTGNGYFGGLQFNQSAWESTGGSGNPANASKDEQIMRGKILQARRGWGPWGACSKKLGLL